MKRALSGLGGFVLSGFLVMAFGIAGATIFTVAAAALAQAAQSTDTTVTVPLGDLLAQVLQILEPAAVAGLAIVLGFVLKRLPAGLQALVGAYLTNQVLARAVDYAFNVVADATKGEKVTADVGSRIVKEAVDYVLGHAPGWLKAWMGGEVLIRQKVIARLDTAKGTALR